MVKGALWKKAFQDMRKSKAQFISIFVMAALAIGMLTGLDSLYRTVDTHSSNLYSATNLSDLWVTVSNPSEKDLWRIGRIAGVEQVEKRFSIDAETNLPGEPTLHVYALESRSTLDQPELQAGRFGKRGGAVLDATFAKAHGLGVGDSVSVKMNGRWLELPIEGLALSGEQIYSLKNSATMTPDPNTYGFVVIRADALSGIYGQAVFNQISVKTAANADLSSVVRQADEAIGDRLIGIVARDDSVSASNVISLAQQFKTLSNVFPALFFLVAALITQSTMVRLVENQRSQIGLLKALGYSRRTILWHYTSYGVFVGLAGATAGLLLGKEGFARILLPQVNLVFPDYKIYVDWGHFLAASILLLLCTGGISLYSCRRLLDDTPAVLLRGKPSKSGNHIFLERMSALWNKIKFSNKLIARNTLKNKSRIIMSTIGVMGCTGVIVAALSINDMITGISGQIYQDTFSYDHKVLVDTSKTDSRYLNNLVLDGVTQQVQETAVEVICPDGRQKMEPLTITPRESPLIHLKTVDGVPVSIPENGILMTRKLCETLGVQPGDSIQIKRSNQGYGTVPVVQSAYMASGQGMYMTDTYWKSLNQTFQPTALLIKWNSAPDEAFLSSDAVEDFTTREEQEAGFSDNTQIMALAISLLIAMGAALAFAVLYNCGILNYSERVRDLATLRVLGFHQEEIRNLVLLENYFSVLFGLIFGVPTGWLIAQTVAVGLDKQMDLSAGISPQVVLIAGAVTLLFAWITNQAVAKKMKNLDMLEALKSVE